MMFSPFAMPNTDNMEEAAAILEEKMAATPGAPDVSDVAAYELFTIVTLVGVLDGPKLEWLARKLEIRIPPKASKLRGKRLILWFLRRFWLDKMRCQFLVIHLLMPIFEEQVLQFNRVYKESLALKLLEWVPPIMVAGLIFRMDLGDHIPELLAAMSPADRLLYRCQLAGTKMAVAQTEAWLAQVKAGQTTESEETLVQETHHLTTKVRQRDAEVRRLRQQREAEERAVGAQRKSAAAAERNRQALARVAQEELDRLQARAAERSQARQAELADARRRYDDQITALQAQLGATRSDFATALADMQGPLAAQPLAGLTVTVDGRSGYTGEYRALVETAGGRYVTEGADLTVIMGGTPDCPKGEAGAGVIWCPGTTLVDLERTLRGEWRPRR